MVAVPADRPARVSGRMPRTGVRYQVLLVKEADALMESRDPYTGEMRVINATDLLSKLSDCRREEFYPGMP
jgi:hypothetical protein